MVQNCLLAFYPIWLADSKLRNTILEKAFGSSMTGRNLSDLTRPMTLLGWQPVALEALRFP